MRFAFIAENQHLYPVSLLCSVMSVARSGVQVVTAVRLGKLRGVVQRESITTHYDRAHGAAYSRK